MRVWLDADSCPQRIREILARAAKGRKIEVVFVANRRLPPPRSGKVSGVVVPRQEGAADAYIAENARPGDLAVTRDIPLAAQLLDRGLGVINDRGDVFTPENIGERLSVRNFMKDLREAGLYESPAGGFGAREIRLFSDAFDRELTRLLKNREK